MSDEDPRNPASEGRRRFREGESPPSPEPLPVSDLQPSDSIDAQPYTEEFLRDATTQQLSAALSQDQARSARIQTELPFGGPTYEQSIRQLQFRQCQLANALRSREQKDFWDSILVGCPPTENDQGDPAIQHATALYNDCKQGQRRAFEHRLKEIQRANMSPAGKAVRQLELTEEVLVDDVKERVKIYREVAAELRHVEMLSRPFLELLRCRIARTIGFTLLARQQEIALQFAAAGFVGPEPHFNRYKNAAHNVLDIARAQIEVLRTKYDAQRAKPSAAVPSTDLPPSPADSGQVDLDRLLEGKTEVDLKTAAKYLGKSLDHVRRLARDRAIYVTRNTRPKRVSCASLRRYLRPKS